MLKLNLNRDQGYPETGDRNESYPAREVLAAAVAVFRNQGFIRSGQGYYDEVKEVRVNDNRDVCLSTLRLNNIPGYRKRMNPAETTVEVTEQDREKAEEIIQFFKNEMVMKELTGNLNDFERNVAHCISSEEISAPLDFGVIASLPNSYVVAEKRNQMSDFYEKYGNNGYYSQVRERNKIRIKIFDSKFIPKDNIHLMVGLTEDEKIIKFFMKDVSSEWATNVEGKYLELSGTVAKQEVNPHTNAQETRINRVKIHTS